MRSIITPAFVAMCTLLSIPFYSTNPGVSAFVGGFLSRKSTSTGLKAGIVEGVGESSIIDRSSMLRKVMAGVIPLAGVLAGGARPSLAAKADCVTDCLKNCRLIAPKDDGYCADTCKTYCSQEDRTDGLSGSVSSDGGEVGILGQGTVVKGEDKPPSIRLPGLDFSSGKGKKLIGY